MRFEFSIAIYYFECCVFFSCDMVNFVIHRERVRERGMEVGRGEENVMGR